MDKGIESAVRLRARDVCEYCHFPQEYAELRFVIDHIIARQHGGPTASENLALACGPCNRQKGPNIAGLDPADGALTRLLHPRKDVWRSHFRWDGATIVGLTAVGRTTIVTLSLNSPAHVMRRRAILRRGAKLD
ncbi:MAG: restriction endonuclease [Phycisphaerales bacterium]|jgi:hypothetical protein|nr:restriction endonuclease [Phycisphaerales bacterium]